MLHWEYEKWVGTLDQGGPPRERQEGLLFLRSRSHRRRRRCDRVALHDAVCAHDDVQAGLFLRHPAAIYKLHLGKKYEISHVSKFVDNLFYLISIVPFSESGEFKSPGALPPPAPVRQCVAKLAPKPRVVVFHVRIHVDVVGQGASHFILRGIRFTNEEREHLPDLVKMVTSAGSSP